MARINERRIGELVKEDPSLLPRHAQRIAELEFEAGEWRQRALTDPITGLLSERAHIADVPAGEGHAAMALPDVQAVYDNCGQQSGNVFLQDVAAVLRAEATKHEARLYRIGTAKLAAITVGLDQAAVLMAALKNVLDRLSITCVLEDGRIPDASLATSGGLADFLANQQGTFGATVRARLHGDTAHSSQR